MNKNKKPLPTIAEAHDEALQVIGEARRLLGIALQLHEQQRDVLGKIGTKLNESEASVQQLVEVSDRRDKVLSKVAQQRDEAYYQIEALMHICQMSMEPEYEYEPDLPGEFDEEDEDE